MKRSQAEILREYGPFPGVDNVHGVTFDGRHVWFVVRRQVERLRSCERKDGALDRSIVAAHAGTAFDGQHLFQIAEDRIQKIDPKTGRVLATIPAPGNGGDSGLAWAEGTLWVGQHRGPENSSSRSRDGGDSSHHRIQPRRHRGHMGRRRALARHLGGRRERCEARRSWNGKGAGEARDASWKIGVSSWRTSDGGDQFFCGGGRSGKVRAVRRPRRGSAAKPKK